MIKYSDFYFRTDLWDKPIIWNWKEQVRHEANNHKTFKPKISYLEILLVLMLGLKKIQLILKQLLVKWKHQVI